MVTIRMMSPAEVDRALAWAAEEGWNPGLEDADAFRSADPDGFLLAVEDATPIGCIAAVRYGASFGFLGLYIVRPDHRGRGVGITLWRAALERFAGRVIGLDGVVAPPGPVFLDVPEPNTAALTLARDAAMTPVFETARMYAGQAPDMALDQVFGITTFELG